MRSCRHLFSLYSFSQHNTGDMQAMLLAAGFGTRLRPYSALRPKPLFPVLNRPLLFFLLDMLVEAGCDPIIVNCHHLAEQVKAAVSRYPFVILQEEPVILGTGGSLRRALSLFTDEPVLVMNGDILHAIDPVRIYEHHCRQNDGVTMVMHDYPRFNSVAVEDNRVRSFSAGEEEALLAFTGIHVLDPRVIRMIREEGFVHIIDFYAELIRRGEQIGIVRADGTYWRDIGTPEDYLRLHEELLSGAVHLPGLSDACASSWCIDPSVKLGRNVRLDGWGCIGPGARIGDQAHLVRSIVWDGATVQAGTSLVNAIITAEQ